jgi:hypothetical protein
VIAATAAPPTVRTHSARPTPVVVPTLRPLQTLTVGDGRPIPAR